MKNFIKACLFLSALLFLLSIPFVTWDPPFYGIWLSIRRTSPEVIAIIILFVGVVFQAILKNKPKKHDKVETQTTKIKSGRHPSGILDVVGFFLKLYKLQSGAPEECSGEFNRIDAKSSQTNVTYTLRIIHQGRRMSKRVTVGLLGEKAAAEAYVIM